MLTLVTGASGTVGREVVAQLLASGEPVRAARTTRRSDTSRFEESVLFDFTDPGTYPNALDGVDRIFLMRPPALSDVVTHIRPFIRAAAERHVAQVVFLSVSGVNRLMPHWQVERDLSASGLPHTLVRPSFFTQNLAGAYRSDIVEHDRIRLPAGSGRTAFVDTRDVAAVAVAALLDPAGHAGRAYPVTGTRAWTYDEVAGLLSEELARPIRYERVGFLRYRAELRAEGLPADYVRVQLLINAVARFGRAATTTDVFARLIGRNPIALPDSIHHLRDAWRVPDPPIPEGPSCRRSP